MFTVLPNSKSRFPISASEQSLAFFLVILPSASVHPTIRPCESPLTMFLVIEEVSFVWSSIRIKHLALSIHPILGIFTNISLAAAPIIITLTMKLVILPISFIIWIIRKFQNPKSISRSFTELAFVYRAIFQCLNPLTMRLIFYPEPIINFPIDLGVLPTPIRSITNKFTLINILVLMDKLALPLHLIILPKSMVLGTIRPNLSTLTMLLPICLWVISHGFLHLTWVYSTLLSRQLFDLEDLLA